MEDIGEKRREYLRRIVAINFQRLSAAACVVASILIGLSALWIFGPATKNYDRFGVLFYSVLTTAGAGLSFGVSLHNSANCQARRFPHVAPVADQIAALPVEEILLHASDPPSALPGELVRATAFVQETSASELLRAKMAL